jgi:translation elongation factor EF-1beta
MSKSFTCLKAINSIPKMNKLYELSQNQKNQLNKKLQQNKNFLIEIAFGKAKMKLKVVTKLINTIEIQFNDQFLFISNEILD